MKDLNNHDKYMLKATELLGLNALRVFIIWYTDTPDYAVSVATMHKRMPWIDRQNFSRAFKQIEKAGLIARSGKYYKNRRGEDTVHYVLNESILIPNQIEQEVADTESISTTIPNQTEQHTESDRTNRLYINQERTKEENHCSFSSSFSFSKKPKVKKGNAKSLAEDEAKILVERLNQVLAKLPKNDFAQSFGKTCLKAVNSGKPLSGGDDGQLATLTKLEAQAEAQMLKGIVQPNGDILYPSGVYKRPNGTTFKHMPPIDREEIKKSGIQVNCILVENDPLAFLKTQYPNLVGKF